MCETTYSFPREFDIDDADFRQVVDTRSDDAGLHYRFGLPSTWKQVESPVTTVERATDFVELSRFASANDLEWVTVSVARLPREVGASEWLHLAMQHEARVILDRDDHYTRAGSMPDVLSRRQTKAGPRVERSTVLKNGESLFRVDYSAPAFAYNEQAAIGFAITHSLQPILEADLELAEPTVVHAIDPIRDVTLPDSWEAAETTFLSLAGACDSLGGALGEWQSHVGDAWSGTIFAGRGVAVEGAGEHLRLAYLSDLRACSLDFSRVELRDVKLAGTDFRAGFWIEPKLPPALAARYFTGALLLECETEVLLIGQFGPAFDASPEWLAINQRAFEIARDSLTAQ